MRTVAESALAENIRSARALQEQSILKFLYAWPMDRSLAAVIFSQTHVGQCVGLRRHRGEFGISEKSWLSSLSENPKVAVIDGGETVCSGPVMTRGYSSSVFATGACRRKREHGFTQSMF